MSGPQAHLGQNLWLFSCNESLSRAITHRSHAALTSRVIITTNHFDFVAQHELSTPSVYHLFTPCFLRHSHMPIRSTTQLSPDVPVSTQDVHVKRRGNISWRGAYISTPGMRLVNVALFGRFGHAFSRAMATGKQTGVLPSQTVTVSCSYFSGCVQTWRI